MIDKVIKDKFGELRLLRQPFEPVWEELARYFNPYRENLFNDVPLGTDMGKYIFDSTGVSSVRMLAEGLFGYLMSPAIDWFKLEIADEDDPEITSWLQGATKELYASLRRSNFYGEVVEFLTDGITFGTGIMYFEENMGDGNVFFKVISPAQVWIDEDAYGRIRTVFRREKYTKSQVADKFSVKDIEGRVIHVVVPDKKGTWLSLWYHEKTGKILRKSHYDYFPYIIWRCVKNPRSVYGLSPALISLPIVKMLNKISKTLIEASQLAVKPPLNAPVNAEIDRTPDGINYYSNPSEVVSAVNLGINFPIGKDREEAIQKAIREFFNVDFFLMFAHQERAMTATEVVERQGEKAAMLGNIIGRLMSELLDQTIEGTVCIEYKAGRLPEAPESLGDRWVDIEYLGPLAVAQKKLFETKGLNHALEGVAPILSAKPEAGANFDWNYLVRYAYSVAGAPVKGLLPEEMVQQKQALEMIQQAGEQVEEQ